MSTTHTASLGCGTLILIALIVFYVVHVNTADLGKDMEEVNRKVDRLESTVERQTDSIQELKAMVNMLIQEQKSGSVQPEQPNKK